MAQVSPEALDALTRAIAERLEAVVPAEASPEAGITGIRSKLEALVNQPGEPQDNVLIAAHAILSHVQDEITRDLKTGWPRPAGGVAGVRDRGEDLPWGEAEISSGMLRLWYGEKDNAALELPSIPLQMLEGYGRV